DAGDRRQRRDVPVGAERETCSGVEKRAERIGRAAPFGADSLLGPAAVVDRVIRLHRGDDAELREPTDVRGTEMLRVLDAEATVPGAVGARDAGEEVEDLPVGAVSDRMDHDLQPGAIRAGDALFHARERN